MDADLRHVFFISVSLSYPVILFTTSLLRHLHALVRTRRNVLLFLLP